MLGLRRTAHHHPGEWCTNTRPKTRLWIFFRRWGRLHLRLLLSAGSELTSCKVTAVSETRYAKNAAVNLAYQVIGPWKVR